MSEDKYCSHCDAKFSIIEFDYGNNQFCSLSCQKKFYGNKRMIDKYLENEKQNNGTEKHQKEYLKKVGI